MSQFDYLDSQLLEADNHSFYALIMAAMRRADSDNIEKLKAAFPETWKELDDRYHAPGGKLPGEALEICSLTNREEE
jgi:hypothetical protein